MLDLQSAAMKRTLLEFTDSGIYCPKADVYLDPWKPVSKALISHAHADHSRWGHQHYISHEYSTPIIKHRLGGVEIASKKWGERFSIQGVHFSFHPAGHIVGSSQIKVEYKGETWVFSGDYKTYDDGFTTPFEPQKCDVFITECTFGIPAFKWPSQELVFDQIQQWWKENAEKGITSVLFGYSLGKAQRLSFHLREEVGPLLLHPVIHAHNEVVGSVKPLPHHQKLDKNLDPKKLKTALILAPPNAQDASWLKKWMPYKTAAASGWMATRGARRRRGYDTGFVLSDHADFYELTNAIKATEAQHVICTHGYTDIYARFLNSKGIYATTADTPFEDEPVTTEERTS